MRGYFVNVRDCEHGPVEASGLEDYYRLIGCRCIDIAVRDVGGRPYNIVLDDEGLLVDSPVVSAYMGNEPALAGNLIFFGLDESTFDVASLSDDDVENIKNHMRPVVGVLNGCLEIWPVVMMDEVASRLY